MPRPRHLVASSAATVLLLGACGAATDATSDPTASEQRSGGTAYPLTVTNCGTDVVFEEAPRRVVLLEAAPVTILDGLGVLDRVVSVAGTFPEEYYEPDLAAQVADLEKLSEDIDASGHLMISPEVVIAQQPDLVLGLPDGVTREGMRDAGANSLIQPVYCPTGVGETTFDSLYEQVRTYGQVFDRTAEAEAMVEDLTARVSAVQEATADAPERSAAVLYPSIGGGPLYAYGRASMAHPQLEAAGLRNVFDDADERVFEVSVEELVGRDPDVLVLLHQGEEDGVVQEVADLPGADALRALGVDGAVIVQLFNFTEPPTPLAVTGLERIVAALGTGR